MAAKQPTNRLAIALSIFTVGIVLGGGLCGASGYYDPPSSNAEFGTGPLGSAGFLAFLICLPGFAITLLIGIGIAVARLLMRLGRKDDEK